MTIGMSHSVSDSLSCGGKNGMTIIVSDCFFTANVFNVSLRPTLASAALFCFRQSVLVMFLRNSFGLTS